MKISFINFIIFVLSANVLLLKGIVECRRGSNIPDDNDEDDDALIRIISNDRSDELHNIISSKIDLSPPIPEEKSIFPKFRKRVKNEKERRIVREKRPKKSIITTNRSQRSFHPKDVSNSLRLTHAALMYPMLLAKVVAPKEEYGDAIPTKLAESSDPRATMDQAISDAIVSQQHVGLRDSETRKKNAAYEQTPIRGIKATELLEQISVSNDLIMNADGSAVRSTTDKPENHYNNYELVSLAAGAAGIDMLYWFVDVLENITQDESS